MKGNNQQFDSIDRNLQTQAINHLLPDTNEKQKELEEYEATIKAMEDAGLIDLNPADKYRVGDDDTPVVGDNSAVGGVESSACIVS